MCRCGDVDTRTYVSVPFCGVSIYPCSTPSPPQKIHRKRQGLSCASTPVLSGTRIFGSPLFPLRYIRTRTGLRRKETVLLHRRPEGGGFVPSSPWAEDADAPTREDRHWMVEGYLGSCCSRILGILRGSPARGSQGAQSGAVPFLLPEGPCDGVRVRRRQVGKSRTSRGEGAACEPTDVEVHRTWAGEGAARKQY